MTKIKTERRAKFKVLLFIACMAISDAALSQTNTLTIKGTRFYLNDADFVYNGISFFNAIYNPVFTESSENQKEWMSKFKAYGINVLRVWAQWDNTLGFVDTCPDCSLYDHSGMLRAKPLQNLVTLLKNAGEEGVVIEIALFSHETTANGNPLSKEASQKAIAAIAKELLPYRNLTFQIWNESSENVLDYFKLVKSVDPKRLVTNSPGFAGNLGDTRQNETLDFLTPHTSRQNVGDHWNVAIKEVQYLLSRFNKPVVDDEPARNGTSNFGGPKKSTNPYDHILQMRGVWQVGGYTIYHHDMFQLKYGSPSTPPSGIPDPEFNPYHKQVLEFLKLYERYKG